MKKRLWLSGLLGLSMAVSIVGLAACAPTVESISVSGGDVEYVVGEKFSTEGVVVTAAMSNETTQDVTAEAQINADAVDMETAGEYTVTVTYGEFKTEYKIKVLPIDEIEVRVNDAETEYYIGDTVSYDGITVTAYQGEDFERKVDLDACTVTLTDKDGTAVTGAFEALGTYTVTVTYYGQSDSYEVVVSNAVAIKRAIESATANALRINGGTSVHTTSRSTAATTVYEFGDNYLHFTESGNAVEVRDFYLGVDENGNIFALRASNGALDINSNITEEYAGRDAQLVMMGIDFNSLFYGNSDLMANGVEALISMLYEVGTGTSKTLSSIYTPYHYADSVTDGTYSFSFGVIAPYGASNYYYEVEASFTLSEAGCIDHAVVRTYQYLVQLTQEENGEYFTIRAEGDRVTEGYYMVDADGKLVTDASLAADVRTQGQYDFWYQSEVTQEEGARNAESPYPLSASKLYLRSFVVKDADGNEIKDGDTIRGSIDRSNPSTYPSVVLNIEQLTPEDANLVIEQFSCDPFFGNIATCTVDKENMLLTVYFRGHGTQELTISTTYFTFRLNVIVDGYSPNELTAQTMRADETQFTSTDEITVFVGDKLTVRASTETYAFPGYSAALDTSDGATLDIFEEGSNSSPYIFMAQRAGVYRVTFRSTKILSDGTQSDAQTTLTITVMDVPDMSLVLGGDYVSDGYTFSFNPATDGALSGKLVVTNADMADFKETFEYAYDETTKTFTKFDFIAEESSTSIEAQTRFVFGLSVDSQYRVCYENARRETIVLNRPIDTAEIAKVLSGTYRFTFIIFEHTVKFTPAEAGALNGTVTIEGENAETFAYSYNVSTGAIICTGNTKCGGLSYHDGKLFYISGTGNELEMTKQEADLTPVIQALSGEYTYTHQFFNGTVTFQPVSEGAVEGTVVLTGTGITVNLTYGYNSDTEQITLQEHGIYGGLKLENGKLYLLVTFMGSSWLELAKEGGSDPDPTPGGNTLQIGDNNITANESTWMTADDAYTFTATEAGTYIFSVPETSDAFIMDDLNAWDGVIDTDVNNFSYSVTLAAGESITLYMGSFGSGAYVLTVTKQGGETPTNASKVAGTWTNTNFTLVFNSDGTGSVTFLGEGGGTESFTWRVSETPDTWGDYPITFTMDNGTRAPIVVQEASLGSVSGAVEYGVITVRGTDYDYQSFTKNIEEPAPSNTLQVGDNNIVAAESAWQDADHAYTFTATEAGTYIFSVPSTSDAIIYDSLDAWDAIIDVEMGSVTYTVTLTAGQTITLYVCSGGSGAYVLTVTKQAASAPTNADKLVGTWTNENFSIVLNSDGTGSVTFLGEGGGTEAFTWRVSETADWTGDYPVTFTMNNGTRATIVIQEAYLGGMTATLDYAVISVGATDYDYQFFVKA